MIAEIDLAEPVNRDHLLNQGCIAWWLAVPGRDGGRQFYDLFGLCVATLINQGAGAGWAATARPGGLGQMVFAGTTGYLTASLANKPTAALSYELWVRTSNLSTSEQALRGTDGLGGANYGFTLSLSGVTVGKYLFALKTGADNLLESAATTDTGWHHVVATYDGATQAIYVDGKLSNSQAASGTVVYSAGAVLMGCGNSSSNLLAFTGAMDGIRLYNRGLSAGEVKALYDLSREGYDDMLNRVSPVSVAPAAAAGGGFWVWPKIALGGHNRLSLS